MKKTESVRVCIIISPEIIDKIAKIQYKELRKTGKNYSFSRAISDILEEHFQ